MVNTAFEKRRSQYDIGIGYDDDIAAAQELCLNVLKETDGVLDDPAPDTIMTEMGDSAVVFRVRWWTNSQQADVMQVQNLALREMKNRLTDEGFDIPYPIRTVYLNQDDADTPSDA
jgi:small-conductance mechanosensitive channel